MVRFLEVPGSKVKGGTERILFEHVKTHIGSQQVFPSAVAFKGLPSESKSEILKVSTASPK